MTGRSDAKRDAAKDLLKHGKRCSNCRHCKEDDAGPPIGVYEYCFLKKDLVLDVIFNRGCDKWSLK